MISKLSEIQDLLARETEKTPSKVMLLLRKGEFEFEWDAHSALDSALQALEIAEEISYDHGMARALVLSSRCRLHLGDASRALVESEAALKIFESEGNLEGELDSKCTLAGIEAKNGDFHRAIHIIDDVLGVSKGQSPRLRARIQSVLGGIYQSFSGLTNALNCYHKALDICVSASDERGRASAVSAIGSVYFDLGDFATSISYHQQSLVIYQMVDDIGGEAYTLERMGELCTRMGALEDALAFLRRSMVLRREMNNDRGVAVCMLHIGGILAKQDLDDQAFVMYKESLNYWKSTRDYEGVAETYLGFVHLYLKVGSILFNNLRANELLAKCLRIAKDYSLKRLELRVHEAYTLSYKQINMHRKALLHYELATELKDKIASEAAVKQVQQLEYTLMRDKTEREAGRPSADTSELTDAKNKVDALNDHVNRLVQEKKDVFASVYHDLKNPISGILVHTSTLDRYVDRMSVDDLRKTVAAITSAAHRMRDMVSELLKGDGENADDDAQIESVDLSEIAREVVEESRNRAFAKSLKIEFRSEQPAYSVSASRTSLRRCIENFVSNAIKYSPNNKTITVLVRGGNRKGFVRCEVKDQGPGISEEGLKQLFTRNVKTGNKTTGGEDSNGVGLVSVKRLIKKMRGYVDCESQPGVGSTFFFEIPLDVANAQPTSTRVPA